MTKVDRLIACTADAIAGALRLQQRQVPGLRQILRLFADEVISERGIRPRQRRKPFARLPMSSEGHGTVTCWRRRQARLCAKAAGATFPGLPAVRGTTGLPGPLETEGLKAEQMGRQRSSKRTAKGKAMTYEEQLEQCDHVPFMHDLLTNKHECLCGKTSIPIRDRCPVPACLCGRPKAQQDGTAAQQKQ